MNGRGEGTILLTTWILVTSLVGAVLGSELQFHAYIHYAFLDSNYLLVGVLGDNGPFLAILVLVILKTYVGVQNLPKELSDLNFDH